MRICIQNLGMYNEGTLLFKWLDLPVSEEELKTAYDEIKISHDDITYYNDCGCPYEEIMIADWEDIPTGLKISEWSNIEELNNIAEQYDNLADYEQEILSTLLKDGYDFEDAINKIDDCFFIEANDDTELAEKYIDEVYGGITNLDTTTLARYFDYEAFGRDLSYDFIQTENGYVSQN